MGYGKTDLPGAISSRMWETPPEEGNMFRAAFGYLHVGALLVLLVLSPDSPPLTTEAHAGGPQDNILIVLVEQPTNPYYRTEIVTLADGTKLGRIAINGPSEPPPGYEIERAPATLPKSGRAGDATSLLVPAYDWVFGCSSVSAAMIGGYFDRNGLPNIYIGPANGGVMPIDNSIWPGWTDRTGKTYPSLPLAASRNGLDGRSTRGSIDNYWVAIDSTIPDPYITNGWQQHTWGDAFGDFMKTSQSNYDNADGQTYFYWGLGGKPLTCTQMEEGGISQQDGSYGRKLFYEARGYHVADCYSQLTDNVAAGGFTFAQFKAQIDAGTPVMVNLEGHTIVGVGYKEPDTIYINDTWDYKTHEMPWGGSYSGMKLNSVSIVTPHRPALPTIASLNPSSATAGGPGFTLTVNGTNFVNGSVVHWNGASRATVYMSPSQLKATILVADIASPSAASVTVVNPGTGGTSNVVSFVVLPRQTSFRAYAPLTLFTKAPLPPPTGPTPGFWRHVVDNRMQFYVTPDRAFVDDFAIQVAIDDCGNFTITHLVPEKIAGMEFTFSGPFYASGIFSSDKQASGTVGLKDYDMRDWDCGFVTGGPWPWEANWMNSNQPAGLETGGSNWVTPVFELDHLEFQVR